MKASTLAIAALFFASGAGLALASAAKPEGDAKIVTASVPQSEGTPAVLAGYRRPEGDDVLVTASFRQPEGGARIVQA